MKNYKVILAVWALLLGIVPVADATVLMPGTTVTTAASAPPLTADQQARLNQLTLDNELSGGLLTIQEQQELKALQQQNALANDPNAAGHYYQGSGYNPATIVDICKADVATQTGSGAYQECSSVCTGATDAATVTACVPFIAAKNAQKPGPQQCLNTDAPAHDSCTCSDGKTTIGGGDQTTPTLDCMPKCDGDVNTNWKGPGQCQCPNKKAKTPKLNKGDTLTTDCLQGDNDQTQLKKTNTDANNMINGGGGGGGGGNTPTPAPAAPAAPAPAAIPPAASDPMSSLSSMMPMMMMMGMMSSMMSPMTSALTSAMTPLTSALTSALGGGSGSSGSTGSGSTGTDGTTSSGTSGSTNPVSTLLSSLLNPGAALSSLTSSSGSNSSHNVPKTATEADLEQATADSTATPAAETVADPAPAPEDAQAKKRRCGIFGAWHGSQSQDCPGETPAADTTQ